MRQSVRDAVTDQEAAATRLRLARFLSENAIGEGWVITYDGRARQRWTDRGMPWGTYAGAQRVLDKSPMTKAREGKVVRVVMIMVDDEGNPL